jgi:hypothetical protein
MNSKSNQIELVFAPETEFQVQTLIILSEDRIIEALEPTNNLNLWKEIEFLSRPSLSCSGPND